MQTWRLSDAYVVTLSTSEEVRVWGHGGVAGNTVAQGGGTRCQRALIGEELGLSLMAVREPQKEIAGEGHKALSSESGGAPSGYRQGEAG